MASRKKPLSSRAVWNDYKQNCKRKNVFYGLSPEDVEALVHQDCFYCAAPPANLRQIRTQSLTYNGIDRKDNDRGYVLGNCVPCCHRCNSVKGNKLSFKEMVAVGRTLRVLDASTKRSKTRR